MAISQSSLSSSSSLSSPSCQVALGHCLKQKLEKGSRARHFAPPQHRHHDIRKGISVTFVVLFLHLQFVGFESSLYAQYERLSDQAAVHRINGIYSSSRRSS